MGLVRQGCPQELILVLRDLCQIDTFVETGTNLGETAKFAISFFDNVYTIEADKDLFELAKINIKNMFDKDCNDIVYNGDSRDILLKILPKLNKTSIFWLDAHYSGEKTFGKNDVCPLLEELEIIAKSDYEHIIIIDDARLFLSPANSDQLWPSIDKVFDNLKLKYNPYIVIVEDMIISVPISMKDIIFNYCRRYKSRLWFDILTKLGYTIFKD